MKSNAFLWIGLILLSAWAIVACEDKDTQKPVISNLEVGHNDTIYAGAPIHLEFEVTDNDLLDYYHITIHAEEEHLLKSSFTGTPWEFDSTFREISGVKNYTVHHHAIRVPAEATPGDYHFHLKVADKSGNVAKTEKSVIMTVADSVQTNDFD